MPVSPFDSAIMRDLLGDDFASELFSDEALISAMLEVEAHLARVQGEQGVIPKTSGEAIFDACRKMTISPASLGAGMRTAGVPVPALVDEIRAQIDDEHARFVHWGATSQDIVDTGLVLRLSRLLDELLARLKALLNTLSALATRYRDLPMTARTRGQIATPTSFGAKIAAWGSPFLRHLDRLDGLSPRLLTVSFAGASGNLSALGDDGLNTADALADSLGLGRQTLPWHSSRDTIAEFIQLMQLITGSCGKMGRDLVLLSQSELREVSFGTAGGSSTMPHKANPVGAEALVTLAMAGESVQATPIMRHEHERDGAAWATEWFILPHAATCAMSALRTGVDIASSLKANPERMMAAIDGTQGLIFAEAATFALAKHMPRPEAQTAIKAACLTAKESDTHLQQAIAQALPDYDLTWAFEVENALGAAPDLADRFVAAVKQKI